LDGNNFTWARLEKRKAILLVGYFMLGRTYHRIWLRAEWPMC
jgi:hypothetical protein